MGPELNIINFIGGEPTLHPALPDLLEICVPAVRTRATKALAFVQETRRENRFEAAALISCGEAGARPNLPDRGLPASVCPVQEQPPQLCCRNKMSRPSRFSVVSTSPPARTGSSPRPKPNPLPR